MKYENKFKAIDHADGEMKEDKEIIINSSIEQQSLIKDLHQIIEQARGHVAATANYALSIMYWQIGKRINSEVLDNKRAEYGKQIVASVARQLREEYGSKGFDEKNIRRMMQFAQEFPDEQIVTSLMRQLSWTHILQVLSLKDSLQREFYLTLAASERWSVRQLRKEIDGMLYERTAISGKPEQFIKKRIVGTARLRHAFPRFGFQESIFLGVHGTKGDVQRKES